MALKNKGSVKSMTERSCVHPFIGQTQKAFREGGSLSNVLGMINDYQSCSNALVKNISPEAKIPHLIGLSIVGLGTIVVWEYARSRGLPLPDSKEIVISLPVVSMTEYAEGKTSCDILKDFIDSLCGGGTGSTSGDPDIPWPNDPHNKVRGPGNEGDY